MSSVIAASDKLDEKQWYDIAADYIDCGKDVFSIVESCYTYNGSSIAELSAGGLYSPLGLYGAIAKAGVASVSQLVRSIGKYSADGEWNLGDTADTLIDFATAGLYEITHYVTRGLDEVIYSAIFKAAGVDGDVNYAEEMAEGFKNVGDTIGIAIGNFIANIILKKTPQDVITYKAYGNSLLIQGSTKSDLIYDNHINDTIFGGTGIDTIGLFGNNSSVYGEGGNDIIVVDSKSNEIYGDMGNDLVIIGQDTASLNRVFGGDGDDEFQIKSDHNTINGGYGNDTIIIEGTADNTVFGGEDNDSIRINDSAINNTVIGGTGDDTISISSAARVFVGYTQGDGNDTIVGFNEDDTLKVSVDYTTDTIGNDVIVYVDSSTITLKDFAGKTLNTNSFQPYDFSALIASIIEPNHSGSNANIDTSVNVISGDNINSRLEGVILSASGSARIYNYEYGDNVTINGSAGSDTIHNGGNNVTISGGDGNDTIYNGGANVTISGGAGDDYIYNFYGVSNVTISGGDGNDSISNSGSNATISGGAGNDTIYNQGDDVTISAGAGDDTIYNWSGSNVTISGGEGNDYIMNGDRNFLYSSYNYGDNAIIDGGDGNDTVQSYGDNVTIHGGQGDDYIYYNDINGDNVIIDGGDGNDTIYGFGENVTISGGKGDDYIHVAFSRDSQINYTLGDGNDTIIGYDGERINFSNTKYSTVISGYDVIIQFENGSITIKDTDISEVTIVNEANKELVPNENISSSETVSSPETVSSTPTPLEKNNNYTYEYTGGDKVITDYSSSNKVKYNTDFTGLDVNGDDLLIKSSSGSLKLENVRNEVIDITDNDENTIAYAYLADYEGVVDGSGFDTFEVIAASEEMPNHLISGDGGSSLISGGSNDTLQGGAGQDAFIYNKGNDVVSNYQDREKINFAATYTGFGFDDNNFFLNAAEGSLTIQNNKDKWIDIATADGNVVAHAYVVNNGGVIDGRNFNELTVIVGGNNARDTIYAGSGGSSLWGGNDGFDTMSGGTGVDMFFYGTNDGDDWIQSASENDVINLYDVTLADIIAADWASPSARAEEGAVFEQALVFTSGRTLGISNLSSVSPTFQLANGSKWQFNRSTTSWQSA